METDFKKITIIGVGLIGGSLALALREKGYTGEITGVGRTIENLQEAKRLGIVDGFSQDVAEGVRGADLVLVAVPVMKTGEVVRAAAPSLEPGCIVTDAGSVKESVISDVDRFLPEGVHFVPGHPIAGTESSGAGAAFAELYRGRVCILTPTPGTDEGALRKVSAMWEEAGSRVVLMDPAAHDKVLAAVSHLPHMIAYSLVNTVADVEDQGTEALSYSAGGFKDFTRIASSSPEMWADICAMNSRAIVAMIEGFQKRLEGLKNLISSGDTEALKAEFKRAKGVRDSLVEKDSGR